MEDALLASLREKAEHTESMEAVEADTGGDFDGFEDAGFSEGFEDSAGGGHGGDGGVHWATTGFRLALFFVHRTLKPNAAGTKHYTQWVGAPRTRKSHEFGHGNAIVCGTIGSLGAIHAIRIFLLVIIFFAAQTRGCFGVAHACTR